MGQNIYTFLIFLEKIFGKEGSPTNTFVKIKLRKVKLKKP